jgi:PAS domain S-box-containing protein
MNPGNGDSYTVLIVDDNAINAIDVKRELDITGFVADVAYSGEECLAMMEKRLPDLVLMDIDLGKSGMDGTEATEEIYRRYDVPVVFHSAHTDRETIAKTKRLTKYGYVQKTSRNTEFLLATIEMAIKLHRTERELKRSRRQYKALFENINCGVAVFEWTGERFRPVDANRAAQRILSLPDIRKNYPRDELLECFSRVSETGKPEELETRRRSPKGERLLSHYVYRLEEGPVVDVFADIIDRVRLEEKKKKYVHAFNNSDSILAIVDRDFRYTAVNRKYCEANLVDEEEVIGKHIWEILGHEKFSYIRPYLDQCFFEGKVVSFELDKEYPLMGLRHLVIRNIPLKDESGEVVEVFAVNTDVTELNERQIRLQRALQERETLMKEIHHRVKNNLAMISSLIELRSTDPAMRPVLADLKNKISSIALIHEKLYMHEEMRSLDINEYLRDLVETIFETFQEREVRVSIETCYLRITPKNGTLLGLIVAELANNAVIHGFRDSESNDFRIDLLWSGGEGGYELIVENTGGPIPEDVDIHSGRTLGFRLVYALTEQLGGSLSIHRGPHPRFEFHFPDQVFSGPDPAP